MTVKVLGVIHGPHTRAGALTLYLTVWPGVRTEPFANRGRPDHGAVRLIRQGALVGAAGLASWALVVAANKSGWLTPALLGWLGVGVILTTLHLGLSDVVTGTFRIAGFPVRRLFADPLASVSLRDFWSRRWNVAFVEMNQVVFVPMLRRLLGRAAYPGTFVLSGLLHELAISLPVRTGFGLPTAYFALHALATAAERPLRIHRWPALFARLWTWGWLLVPLPLLFHRAFRDALVLPLFGGAR